MGHFVSKEISVALMLCDGKLSLHNWIFNSSYVIKQHSVASLARSLKFISKSTYRSTNVEKEIHFHKVYAPL